MGQRFNNSLSSIFRISVLAVLLGHTPLGWSAADQDQQTFTTIEWTDLIPQRILDILMNPPQYVTNTEQGSADDAISSNIKNAISAATDDPYQQALTSTEVKTEMDGNLIRLPGFVVPLEFNDEQVVTQFFLVPYFGACLHMPPPPPNQIVLVNAPKGITLQHLQAPIWASGKLSTEITENDMATAAYSMNLQASEPYTE